MGRVCTSSDLAGTSVAVSVKPFLLQKKSWSITTPANDIHAPSIPPSIHLTPSTATQIISPTHRDYVSQSSDGGFAHTNEFYIGEGSSRCHISPRLRTNLVQVYALPQNPRAAPPPCIKPWVNALHMLCPIRARDMLAADVAVPLPALLDLRLLQDLRQMRQLTLHLRLQSRPAFHLLLPLPRQPRLWRPQRPARLTAPSNLHCRRQRRHLHLRLQRRPTFPLHLPLKRRQRRPRRWRTPYILPPPP